MLIYFWDGTFPLYLPCITHHQHQSHVLFWDGRVVELSGVFIWRPMVQTHPVTFDIRKSKVITPFVQLLNIWL